jgi:voltage-gated potassium channel
MLDSLLLAKMRRHRSVWLLAAIVLCVIATPLQEMGHLPSLTTHFLFGAIVLASVNSATGRRHYLGPVAGLAVVWLLADVASAFVAGTVAPVIANLALIALMVFTIYLILRPLLTVKETDFDTLCGAIAVYLLIALAWAVSYGLFAQIAPGSFQLEREYTWSTALYFSLTTLTTLGFGDITPVSPLARIWTTLEAVFGQLYIAVLVARMVALMRN